MLCHTAEIINPTWGPSLSLTMISLEFSNAPKSPYNRLTSNSFIGEKLSLKSANLEIRFIKSFVTHFTEKKKKRAEG